MIAAGLGRLSAIVLMIAGAAFAVADKAAADSGETGASAAALDDVTPISATDCNTIRNQIAAGFGGDWTFICYGDQTGNPACGLFSTQSDQTNILGYCQDRFPNGVSPRLGDVLKTNVRVLGMSTELTTGLIGTLPSNATVQSNVVCATYKPDTATPGKQVCVQIDATPDTSGSATSCGAPGSPALFRISAPNSTACTTLKSIVEAGQGTTVGQVSFGWMTDVGPPPPATPVSTVGQAGSEGLLLCTNRKATCLGSELPTGFTGTVVRYQLPRATIQEQPDCMLFRGVRYC